MRQNTHALALVPPQARAIIHVPALLATLVALITARALLFLVFTSVLGRERTASLPPEMHWAVILAVSPLLVVLCRLTYLCVEAPSLASVERVMVRLRNRSPGRARVDA